MFKNFSFASLATFLLAYATICGCLWHLGYWSTFNFNFLEFANISDLFKTTLYPFLSSIWFLIVIVIFSFGSSISMYLVKLKRPEIRINTQVPYEIPNSFIYNTLLISAGIIFLLGIVIPNKIAWAILPTAFSIFITLIVFITGTLKNHMKDDFLRLGFIFIIVFYPSLNFTIAKKISNESKIFFRYTSVKEVISADSAITRKLVNAAYLATTGGYYFFYLPEEVIVVSSNKIDALRLERKTDTSKYKLSREYYPFGN